MIRKEDLIEPVWVDDIELFTREDIETREDRGLKPIAWNENSMRGFISEDMVKFNMGHEVQPRGKDPDPGYDIIHFDPISLREIKIDIKSNGLDYDRFGSDISRWSVDVGHHPIWTADVYLFVSTDMKHHKIAVIGTLTAKEIVEKCIFVKKGEKLPWYPNPSNDDCYSVSIKDLRLMPKYAENIFCLDKRL